MSSPEALAYFNGDELPANVFITKYALRDRDDNLLEKSPDEMHRRMAKEFARIEASKFKEPLTEDEIYGYFKDFGEIIPQGSPMAAIGSNQYTSASNCFVLEPPLDSYGSIHRTDQHITQISKRRGGVGTDISHIRPANQPTSNSSRKATGVVPFMERFSNSIREVGQSGRRGALLLTLDVHHPEVIEFAEVKLDPTKVTGANVTIRVSDEFMRAVENDTTYEQRWPVDSPNPVIRQQVSAREVWKRIIHCAWKRAEPGIMFWDTVLRDSPADCYKSLGFGSVSANPCNSANTTFLTPNGIRFLKDLEIGDIVWSGVRWTTVDNIVSTGFQEVYRFLTTAGEFVGTKNHNLYSGGIKDAAANLESVDIVVGSYEPIINRNLQAVVDGLVVGDGTSHSGKVYLLVGRKDFDYFTSEISHLIGDKISMDYTYKVTTTLNTNEICKTYDRSIPNKYFCGDKETVCSFLRGLYSANGSLCCGRVTLKASSRQIILQVQQMLSSVGIRSYFTTNKSTSVKFANGVYKCKQSYDLNITTDKDRFAESIGFIQRYKTEKLNQYINGMRRSYKPIKKNFDIIAIESLGEQEVFDITVDDYSHTYWTGGVLAGNCGEIIMGKNDACRLLLLNLFAFVSNPFTKDAKFDFVKFDKVSKISQRLMDDLVDLELEAINRIIAKIHRDPEPDETKMVELNLWLEIKKTCELGRRTGTGITALGDAMAAVGIRYGSEESVEFTDRVYKTLKLACYRSSVDMAKEIGPFPIWDHNLEKDNPYLNRIKDEDPALWADMKKYGRRNIALLTTAPAGSVSIEAGPRPYFGTTSGIEPLFTDKPYTRRKKINHGEKNARVDFVDAKGDKWTNYEVYHSKLRQWMDVTDETDYRKSPYHGACAEDLDWTVRVRLQAAAQAHVCHSISSCLAAGSSSVATSKGMFDIEELASHVPEKEFGDLNHNISSVNCFGEVSSVTQAFNNGVAKTVVVDCGGGYELTCTPSHKVFVLGEDYTMAWKPAGEVVVGDTVVLRKGLNLWNESGCSLTELVGGAFEYVRKSSSKIISIPNTMTPELARLIGYMCSDGSVGINGISLCQVQNNVCDDFADLVRKLFDCPTRYVKDNRAKSELYNLVVNSREVAAFFRWLGITGHDTIRVPLCIRRSSKSCVKQFLRGVTLDGYVTDNAVGVATSVSKKYIDQLQQLLLNYGIEPVVVNSCENGERVFPSGRAYVTQPSYCLMCCGVDAEEFANRIGFAEDRKNKEATIKLRRSSRKMRYGEVPDHGLRLLFRERFLPRIRSNRLYELMNSVTTKDKQGRRITRETLLEMADFGMAVPPYLLDPTYSFRQVESVSPGPTVQTYDLSVPNGNSYIANGFVSHNTINLPETVSPEKVAEIYETAWRAGCKGMTVYRDKCRDGVLVKEANSEKKSVINKTQAPKRPNELPCDIFRSRAGWADHFILVGLFDGEPYEVFTGPSNESIPSKGHGVIKKAKRGKYDLYMDGKMVAEDIASLAGDEQEAITRLVSTSLRHGADISFITHQLDKVNGNLFGFTKALARTLKKYVPDGTKVHGETCSSCGCEHTLERKEGCVTCKNCGWSKCG